MKPTLLIFILTILFSQASFAGKKSFTVIVFKNPDPIYCDHKIHSKIQDITFELRSSIIEKLDEGIARIPGTTNTIKIIASYTLSGQKYQDLSSIERIVKFKKD
jgi:hypothetical protein